MCLPQGHLKRVGQYVKKICTYIQTNLFFILCSGSVPGCVGNYGGSQPTSNLGG